MAFSWVRMELTLPHADVEADAFHPDHGSSVLDACCDNDVLADCVASLLADLSMAPGDA